MKKVVKWILYYLTCILIGLTGSIILVLITKLIGTYH